MRRRVRMKVAGVLLAGVGLSGLGLTASGAATAPSVSVTPKSNLVDLQSVTVSGSGYSPNATIGTVECRPGALSVSDCDLSTLEYATSDDSGSFTISRHVRRIITVQPDGSDVPETIDCAGANACILGAGNIADLSEATGAPIAFDPNTPPVVPKLQATPDSKLRDHQLISASGSGFTPGGGSELVQCTADDSACAYDTARFVAVSDYGTFTASNFVLVRLIASFDLNGDPVTVDCAKTACVLEAQADFGSSGGRAALSFDPKVPPTVPALKVTPTRHPGDLQLVTVKGTGFVPGGTVYVQQCVGAENSVCDPNSQTVTPGFAGEFTMTFAMHRLIATSAFDAKVGTTDCAQQRGTCRLNAFSGYTATGPSVGLGFDRSIAPIRPQITAQPSTALTDNQLIDVKMKGFTPYRPVQVIECSREAIAEGDLGYCDYSTSYEASTPAGGGAPSTQVFVHRVINGSDGLVDCAAHAGDCVLVASSYLNGGYGQGFGRATATTGRAASPRLRGANFVGASSRRPLQAAEGSDLPGIASVPLRFAASGAAAHR